MPEKDKRCAVSRMATERNPADTIDNISISFIVLACHPIEYIENEIDTAITSNKVCHDT